MTTRNKLLISYFVAILVIALLVLTLVVITNPETYSFSVYWVLLSIIASALPLLPFIILTTIAYKNDSRIMLQSIAEGFILWIYIFFVPILIIDIPVALSGNKTPLFLFAVIQIFISAYLIKRYHMPRGVILPALFFPGIANLFILISGISKTKTHKKIS